MSHYIFVLRHGPTKNKNSVKSNDNNEREILNKHKFKKIAPSVANEIKKYGIPDIILTSPYRRCVDTGKIMSDLFVPAVSNIQRKTKKKLSRWDKKTESHKDAKRRAGNFAEKYKKKHHNKNTLIISHSSVILSIIESLASKEEVGKFHLHSASLSIYDVTKNELVRFNIDF